MSPVSPVFHTVATVSKGHWLNTNQIKYSQKVVFEK